MARGAGMAASAWLKLDAHIRAAGGTDEDIHLLATEHGDEVLLEFAKEYMAFDVRPLGLVEASEQQIEVGVELFDPPSDLQVNYESGPVKANVFTLHLRHSLPARLLMHRVRRAGYRYARILELVAADVSGALERAWEPGNLAKYYALGTAAMDGGGDNYVPCAVIGNVEGDTPIKLRYAWEEFPQEFGEDDVILLLKR